MLCNPMMRVRVCVLTGRPSQDSGSTYDRWWLRGSGMSVLCTGVLKMCFFFLVFVNNPNIFPFCHRVPFGSPDPSVLQLSPVVYRKTNQKDATRFDYREKWRQSLLSNTARQCGMVTSTGCLFFGTDVLTYCDQVTSYLNF